MPAITITDLENAKTDVDHLAAIANSTALTATDRLGRTKQTLAGLSAEFPNAAANAAAAAAAAIQAANEAQSAATAVDLAFAEATAAQGSRVAAESARDAALIQAGVYVDEPTGRAAVADGAAFKVQGSGDVAAYEYRRVNASSSTLIATYPSGAAVAALPQLNTGALKSFVNAAYPSAYSRGSYSAGNGNPPAGTIFGWRSPFKHNGAAFNAVQLTFRGGSAGVFRVEIQSSTFQVLASGVVEVGTSNAVLTVPLDRTVYDIAANQVCYIAYYDPTKTIPAGHPAGGTYDASDADPATNREYYFASAGWGVADPAGNYRIQFRLINANANPRNFADELTTLNNALPTLATKTEQAAADIKGSAEAMTGLQALASAAASSATPVFSRGSYSTGSASGVTSTIFGWKSIFKHNGQPFNLVRFTLKAGSAAAMFRVEIWKTDGTILAAGGFQPTGGTTSTTYAVQLNRIVTELTNGTDAYFVVYHPERTVGVGSPAAGAYDAADANPTTYPDQYLVAGGTWATASPVGGYRIQFDAINTALSSVSLPEINTKNELRNISIPYVVWSHPLGDSEMVGDSTYSLSTIAGFYEQTTQTTVFNAVQGRIWCPDATTAIEWRIWVRDSATTFNMESVTPMASGAIAAGKFPKTESLYTLQLDDAIKVQGGKFIFVMFRAANGTTLRQKKWNYNAGITPARHGFPFTTYGNGWSNNVAFGEAVYNYGQVAPKFLLESQELRAKTVGAASGISYSNAESGLSATDVQTAIDQLAAVGTAPEMVMPPTVYAVEGRECNVYIDNLHVGDSTEFYHDVTSASGTGTQQNERWTWTPTGALASGSLTIDANNKRTGAMLRSVSAQQRAAAASAGSGLNKKIMLIGDSLTSAGTITQTLLDIAGPDVMDVTLVGTRGSAPNKHEGRGGWTVANYTSAGPTYYQFTVSGVSVAPAINSTEYSHNGSVYMVQEVYLTGGAGTIICSVTSGGAPLASGTLTKSNAGAGDATIAFSASSAVSGNPFWIGGAVNFGQYLTNNGFTAPDWVLIQLGTNDVASVTSDASASSAADVAFGKLDTLIASIKAADASTKIGLMIPPPPSADQDSFGANYGSSLNRHRFKRNILIWARQLIAKYAGQEASRVYVVPSNTALDTVNNMLRASATTANSRTSVTVTRQSNGVHPATSGYQQIADAVWAFLKYYA